MNEFGLSRGIDFQNVSNVINFDFPTFDNQYVHRAGRTARAGAKGNIPRPGFILDGPKYKIIGIGMSHQIPISVKLSLTI